MESIPRDRDLRWAKTWIHILVKHKESHVEDVDLEKSMKNPSRIYEISSICKLYIVMNGKEGWVDLWFLQRLTFIYKTAKRWTNNKYLA